MVLCCGQERLLFGCVDASEGCVAVRETAKPCNHVPVLQSLRLETGAGGPRAQLWPHLLNASLHKQWHACMLCVNRGLQLHFSNRVCASQHYSMILYRDSCGTKGHSSQVRIVVPWVRSHTELDRTHGPLAETGLVACRQTLRTCIRCTHAPTQASIPVRKNCGQLQAGVTYRLDCQILRVHERHQCKLLHGRWQLSEHSAFHAQVGAAKGLQHNAGTM